MPVTRSGKICDFKEQFFLTNSSTTNEKKIDSAESRIIPFSVAGIVCFTLALLLGAGSWYLFGTSRRSSPEKNSIAIQAGNQNSAAEPSNLADDTTPTANPLSTPTQEIKKAPAGEATVSGGEITLGGGDTKLPLRRIGVESFVIGATEVTNAQFAEFIEETKHKAPNGWKDDKFPDGKADEPVVNIIWADANDYCEWLSKNLGATVRLPSEAEWELAARGNTDFKYPWGNQWKDVGAESAETTGKVRPVKSFPEGRSPSGAFDMLGNVWEWTSDLFVDELGNPVLHEKSKQRIIKGGSARDSRNYLKIAVREGRPEDKESALIGFRYVIIRK